MSSLHPHGRQHGGSICCPQCGEQKVRHHIKCWNRYDHVSQSQGGELSSMNLRDDVDIDDEYYHCHACESEWGNDTELIAALAAAESGAKTQ